MTIFNIDKFTSGYLCLLPAGTFVFGITEGIATHAIMFKVIYICIAHHKTVTALFRDNCFTWAHDVTFTGEM